MQRAMREPVLIEWPMMSEVSTLLPFTEAIA